MIGLCIFDPDWLRITANYMKLCARMLELGGGNMVRDWNYYERVALQTYEKAKGLVHQTPLNEQDEGAMKYRPSNLIPKGIVLYTQCNQCIMYCESDLDRDTCNTVEVYSKKYSRATVISLDDANQLLDEWADARTRIDELCRQKK